MLILSFSDIAGDARVLKQVVRFTRDYDVTTCGHGPAPEGVVEHIRVPDGMRHNDLNGRLITLKLYNAAYWRISAVKWAREALRGRRFDVAIANDVEAVPIALELKPRCGVLADLHEYSPRQHDDLPLWHKRIRPWMEWLCRRYVSKAAAWSTVSTGIVDEYEREFGFRPELVTNATPFHELTPRPVASPIRLVHSGGAVRARALDVVIDAVLATEADVTLDLFLTPNDPRYLAELTERIGGSPRITLHGPVPYARLIETINAFDVGVHLLPPVNFNHRFALPNKLFDYVQARLGLLIGPSVEMVRYVDEYGLGIVARDFTVDATRAAIEELEVPAVERFKANADAAARELAADRQVDVWQGIIETRLASGGRRVGSMR